MVRWEKVRWEKVRWVKVRWETSGSRKVWRREGPGGASGSGGAVKLEASIFESMPEHNPNNHQPEGSGINGYER